MSRANFTASIENILAHEAGYVNNPKDPGGPTNRGITQATLAAWRGKPVTKADVRALSKDEAVAIYGAEYWNRVHGDALPGGLDYAVVDFAVNSGVGRANRYLQQVLKARKLYDGEIDGVVGAKTLAALSSVKDVAALINDLSTMRLAYLKTLAGWATFGKGWGRRVAEVRAVALKLAAGTHVLAFADLPDPVPTQRGAPAQVAASRTVPGRAAIATAVGVIGDQASGYAATFQGLADIAPVFRYVFAALTVIGVLAGLWKAVQLAQHAEAAAPKFKAPVAANDDEPDAHELVPGTTIELPPGTRIPAAAEADPAVVAIHEEPAPEPAPAQAA